MMLLHLATHSAEQNPVKAMKQWGSTIGLARCGIWLIFEVIFGSWKPKREAGNSITSVSGISCFKELGMRESQGKSSEIWDFNVTRLHELTSEDWLVVQMDPLGTIWTKESKTVKIENYKRKETLLSLMTMLFVCAMLIFIMSIENYFKI